VQVERAVKVGELPCVDHIDRLPRFGDKTAAADPGAQPVSFSGAPYGVGLKFRYRKWAQDAAGALYGKYNGMSIRTPVAAGYLLFLPV
jgi:hypothetical protein